MPFRLPRDFPIVGAEEVYTQRDAPIARLHIHDCLEVGYCHDGSGVYVVGEKIFPYRAGDITVINDREFHLGRSAQGTVSHWTFLLLDPGRLVGPQATRPELLNTTTLGGPSFRNILAGREHPRLAEQVLALIGELRERRLGFREAVRALVWLLMVRLQRLAPKGKEQKAGRRTSVERLAPALEYLAANYAESVAVDALAERCGTSPTHLRRLFHEATGLSPKGYLTQLRLRMAMTLLAASDHSILEVSLAAGFQTLSSFNRHFKQALGEAPRAWRKKQRSS
jgi:AraC-like DNA-binding protein